MSPEEDKSTCDICRSYAPHSDKTDMLKQAVLQVAGLSELFRVLADETRVKILYLISRDELCVCDLAAALEMSMPAISHHLRVLRAMRLVKYRRDGKMICYSLTDEHVSQLITVAQAHYEEER